MTRWTPDTEPQPSSLRIDRRDLANNRQVWFLYAAIFVVVGIASLVIPLLWPSLYSRERLWPFAAGLLATAALALASRPPRLDGLVNHLAIAHISVMSVIGVFVYAPHSLAPIVATLFSGTFSAGRLTKRSHLLAHYLFGTALLLMSAFLADLDRESHLTLVTVVPAVWILGWCTTLICEAAEAQGAELAALTQRDPLTGLGNRRLLDDELSAQLLSHARAGRQLSVLTLDLNGFKSLNDRLGHDAGDALLIAVGAALQRAVRPTDTVVRQGGDEFCVILPETDALAAREVARRITRAIGDLGHGAGVQSGIGLATFPADGKTPADVLGVADRRLQVDKTAPREQERSFAVDAVRVTVVQPPAATRRISRVALAGNLVVWRVFGLVVALNAVLLATVAALPIAGVDSTLPAFCFAAGLAAIAASSFLVQEPPGIDSLANHAIVALPYVGSLVFVLLLPSLAGAVTGPLALAGALAGLRLVKRRQIVMHWALATLCIVGLIASGLVDVPAALALALTFAVIWAVGAGDVIYLEGAEDQARELELLVRRDPLTGVGNRRLLHEDLDAVLASHSRGAHSFSVMALDLNGFKALNDSLGHGAGDELLCRVASALREIAGPSVSVARQGGDEFCLLFPHTNARQAVPHVNAVRAAIAGLGLPGYPVSTGVGVATYPQDALTGDVLLYVADQRLRADKGGVIDQIDPTVPHSSPERRPRGAAPHLKPIRGRRPGS